MRRKGVSDTETIEAWAGNDLGVKIWNEKYRHNGESFSEWLDRVSGGDKRVRQLIAERKFLPAGRILANRGVKERKGTYSNCYVLSCEDSLESIYDAAKEAARTYSYGGGVGIDLSNLAPRGAKVNNAADTSSGAVSFGTLFETTTALIGQHGRRGALMLSMDAIHPDIEEFIDAKKEDGVLTKANMSIRASNIFMMVARNKDRIKETFTRKETGETMEKWLDPNAILDKVAYNAWSTGEPGILFWSTIEKESLLSEYPKSKFKYAGINPCGEAPLPAYGSCNLGSINLAEFVTSEGLFDDVQFIAAVHIAVRALDDILTEGQDLHPLKQQRKVVRDWRQIGLGVMGFADLLIKLGIRYGSEESIELAETISKIMFMEALEASATLAEERGPFEKWDKRVYQSSIMRGVGGETKYRQEFMRRFPNGLRNSQLLAIAPTGSISTMLGVSGGIEPLFALEYERKTKSIGDGEQVHKVIPESVRQAREKGVDESILVTAHDIPWKERIDMQAAWQRYIDASISSTVNLPNDATVQDVRDIYMYAWERKCKGVTVFRDGCNRDAILTTSERKAVEEVRKMDEIMEGYEGPLYDDQTRFQLAFETMLEGMEKKSERCFKEMDEEYGKPQPTAEERHKAKTDALMEKLKSDPEANWLRYAIYQRITNKDDYITNEPVTDDSELLGYKRKLMTGCGSLHCNIFVDRNGNLREVFLSKGSTGGCNNFMIGLSRMISLAARNGIPANDIIDQLNSCGSCPSYAVRRATKGDTSKGACCPMAVGNAIKDVLDSIHVNRRVETSKRKVIDPDVQKVRNPCPTCGAELSFEGGCNVCHQCGWSRCS